MSTATADPSAPTTDSATGNLYEGMFLLDSGKFASDPDGVSGQVLDILQKSGATIVAHRPWQDGKLAYAIEGHRKGTHYLVLFQMPGAGITDVKRACKLNDVILRQMIIKQPKKLFDAMLAALDSGESDAEASDAPQEEPRKRADADDD